MYSILSTDDALFIPHSIEPDDHNLVTDGETL